jgi:hypothetical protein
VKSCFLLGATFAAGLVPIIAGIGRRQRSNGSWATPEKWPGDNKLCTTALDIFQYGNMMRAGREIHEFLHWPATASNTTEAGFPIELRPAKRRDFWIE